MLCWFKIRANKLYETTPITIEISTIANEKAGGDSFCLGDLSIHLTILEAEDTLKQLEHCIKIVKKRGRK